MSSTDDDKGSLPRILSAIALVGILWGCTNTLIRRGAVKVQQKLEGSSSKSRFSSLLAHLTTPAFIIPQVLNLTGSGLFAALLGTRGGALSLVVPAANAAALICTAITDIILKETRGVYLGRLVSGILCIAAGVLLCCLPPSQLPHFTTDTHSKEL